MQAVKIDASGKDTLVQKSRSKKKEKERETHKFDSNVLQTPTLSVNAKATAHDR